MEKQNYLEEIRFWEHPVCRDRPDRGEEQEILQGESDGLSSPTQPQDSSWYDGEAKNDFCLFQEILFSVNKLNPRVKLYVPTEESFLTPLDVIRTTDTNFDVMSEKHGWRLLERRWSKRIVRHVVGKGVNSLSHFYLVHKFIFRPQAMKIPLAKAAVDK